MGLIVNTREGRVMSDGRVKAELNAEVAEDAEGLSGYHTMDKAGQGGAR